MKQESIERYRQLAVACSKSDYSNDHNSNKLISED